MSTEEWRSKSDEWRKGWRAAQQGDDIEMSHDEYLATSDEWKAGARYAIEHPFGPVAVPM